MTNQPSLRELAASRLRGLADRLTQERGGTAGRPPAPLIRLGGRWWRREHLTAPASVEEPPPS
jgi:hypothetical protein